MPETSSSNPQSAEQRIWALLPAAGIGSRMQSELPKQYLEIGDKTILEHSLSNFLKHPAIYKVVVAINPNDQHWPQLEVSSHPKMVTVEGGAERADSVANGLAAIRQMGGEDDWVMVHDAARPCLYSLHIDNLIMARDTSPDGVILAIPSFDTVKVTNNQQTIDKTINREKIWLAQTPQFFPVAKLAKAIQDTKQQQQRITDEASAMEAQGYHPALVVGSKRNIKITEQEDLILASISLSI
ncbi:2-C-methyl-D-erythritol 4-phosphate cytidylyltransferase [Kangiella sp. TOML190]|uniref:2-C-methyl-D-erythritol 4-phosphate cytidylyltransferase n=1 Tax=Kangiella sp. TOML190 TaxID=2931351 RepID=UPI00203D4A03|nr:2-C-methyl-D-erythritol 4-phosphate cytidylyltransferase [Kangiella sp. TOML190]